MTDKTEDIKDEWKRHHKDGTTFGSVVRFNGVVYLYLQGTLVNMSRGLDLPLSNFSDAPEYWEVLQVETEDGDKDNSLIYVIQKHLNIN
jgi:hypothetical protein